MRDYIIETLGKTVCVGNLFCPWVCWNRRLQLQVFSFFLVQTGSNILVVLMTKDLKSSCQ